MDIHSKQGTKVVYTGKNGYDSDRELANKYLVVGQEYTVNKTYIHSWVTYVELEEIKHITFNSVHFEDKD